MDEILVEIWQVIRHSRETEAENLPALQRAVQNLKPYSIKNGIPNFCVDSLIDILNFNVVNTAGSDLAIDIIESLVPNEGFSDSHQDGLFMWLFTYIEINVPACKHFISWFHTAITYDIIKKDLVQKKFYFSLALLMKDPSHMKALSWLLKDLMTPAHARVPFATNMLINLYKESKTAEKRHLSVLLSEMAEHCPAIQKMKLLKPFSVAPPKLDKSLKQLSESWKLHSSMELERDPVTEASTKVSWLSKMRLWAAMDRPELTLLNLATWEGRKHVMFGGVQVQDMIEEQATAAFMSWVDRTISYDCDAGFLLYGISRLHAEQLQGIPSLTKCLELFLVSWDGLDLQEEILDLVPWLHFDTIDELKAVLKGLLGVMIVSDVGFSVRFLLALKNLHINMLTVHLVRRQKDLLAPFVRQHPEWTSDFEKNMAQFSVMVKTIIKTMVLIHGPTPMVLSAALSYYHSVSCVEESLANESLMFWTVVTPTVVVSSQISSCFSVVEQLASLLLRYKRVSLPRLERDNLLETMEPLISLVHYYIKDTEYFLSTGLRSEPRDISEVMVAQVVNDQQCNRELAELAKITHHRAFAPFLQDLCNQLEKPLNTLSPEEVLTIMESFIPNCAELVQGCFPKDQAPNDN